jgi:hypothetical protein
MEYRGKLYSVVQGLDAMREASTTIERFGSDPVEPSRPTGT